MYLWNFPKQNNLISKSTIENVFETARVEEVIGDFVQLKRAGSNFKGLSPFSDERSPSFMVSPVKQIWKDFSSGKGGNSVAFLMEHEHFTYPEAIRYLAKKYNIEIEETELSDDDKAEANEKESMYLVSEFATCYFNDTLLNAEEGKAIGLSYFKERGFTNETITKFRLGYSPTAWDSFTKEAIVLTGIAFAKVITIASKRSVKPLPERAQGTLTNLIPHWLHFTLGTRAVKYASCWKKFK